MKELEEFIDNKIVLHQDKFLSFDKAFQHLDVFCFQSSVNSTKYKSFAFMFKFICILSHGQASVERSFSFRNVILEENLTAESLNAQRIVLDHMISNDLKPESITITAKLVAVVKASRLKYEQAKFAKVNKKLKDSKNEQLEIITKEINELKTKVVSSKKVNEQLDEESETFLFDADANSSKASYFISKETALKLKRNENKDEIKVLEEPIKIREKKRKVNK